MSSLLRLPRIAGQTIPRRCTCQASGISKLPRYPASRNYATSAPRGKGVKVGHLFIGLAVLGIGATSYGLYLFYNSFETWPKPLRGTLRSALRAKQTGDFRNAEKFFRKALTDAKALPADVLGPDRLLKISGIAIALGGFLEDQGNAGGAYEVYEEAFGDLRNAQGYQEFSGPQKMRTIALAQKSAEMAQLIEERSLMSQAEERLGWAVAELLKLANKAPAESNPTSTAIADKDLELPSWISDVDLGASMENLGLLYLKQGNSEYANPLFNQALKLLLKAPSLSDRCHAGTIANNLSSSFALLPTADNLETASQWASNALHITTHAIKDAEKSGKADEVVECRPCQAVADFNLGLIMEMRGDKEGALSRFQGALEKSQKIKFLEGARQALAALQRLNEP